MTPDKSPMALRFERLTGLEVIRRNAPKAKNWLAEIRHAEPSIDHITYVVSSRQAEEAKKAAAALTNDLRLAYSDDADYFRCEFGFASNEPKLVFSRPPGNFHRAELDATLECVEAKHRLSPLIDGISRITADKQDFIFTIPRETSLDEFCQWSEFKRSDLRDTPYADGNASELRINKKRFWDVFKIPSSQPAAPSR